MKYKSGLGDAQCFESTVPLLDSDFVFINIYKLEKVKFSGSYIEFFNQNKKCYWCKSQFEPKDKGDILCSDECRAEFRSMKDFIMQGFLEKGAIQEEITLEIIIDRMQEIFSRQYSSEFIKK